MSATFLMTSSTINRSELSRSLSTGSPFNTGRYIQHIYTAKSMAHFRSVIVR